MTAARPDLVISIRGLVKRYGDQVAVDGLDLDIARGEVFALLGPNGAGKTTTVEILEGHRRADAGSVSVLGDDPRVAGAAWRSRLGIVSQTSKESPEATVRELVRHFATYYPTPRDPDEVITSVGLDEKRHVRAAKLSGGQRRRLDVALGVIGNPELLFLDEPTTGFDPEARRQFWQLVRDLRAGGTTILLTTHYLDEAEQLADRVGVIAEGRLVALDTPVKLGGRSAHIARVSWEEGPEEAAEAREEHTVTPTRFVADLAARLGGEIPALQIRRPTLEDTYLGLIGHGRTSDPGAPPMTTAAPTSSVSTRPAPPSALTIGLARTAIELKLFFRDREALIFIFFFPVLLLGIFTTAFSGGRIGPANSGVSIAQYYAPAMIASGIFLSSFQTLALNIALERDDGTLKRLRGTPMPPLAYFIGKIGLVVITSVLQVAILLGLSSLLLGVTLPSTTQSWITFGWIFLLGSAGGTVLGIAFSVVPKSARSAAAIVTPIVLLLQFISGVYFVFYDLPSWMQQIGALFPLKWLAQGMRSVFFPEQMAALEAAGTWEHGTTAIVLALWLVIGLVACRLMFRWTPRGSG